mgnify:CR=1 FL=1
MKYLLCKIISFVFGLHSFAQCEDGMYMDSTVSVHYKKVELREHGLPKEELFYYRETESAEWIPFQKKEYLDSVDILYEWNNGWIPQRKRVLSNGDGKYVCDEYVVDSISGQWFGVQKSVIYDKPDTTQLVTPVYVWSKNANKWMEKDTTQINEYLQKTEKYLALGMCGTAQWYYNEYKRLFLSEDAVVEQQLSQCKNIYAAEENDIDTLCRAKEEKWRECKEKIEECLQKDACQLADWYYKEMKQYFPQEDTILKNRICDCGKQYDTLMNYIRTEKMPEYLGWGNLYLREYIKNTARQYPELSGVVFVRFLVTSQGNVVMPEIVESLSHYGDVELSEIGELNSPEADKIAIEIITNLPFKFFPGIHAGSECPVRLIYPVVFSKE